MYHFAEAYERGHGEGGGCAIAGAPGRRLSGRGSARGVVDRVSALLWCGGGLRAGGHSEGHIQLNMAAVR